jgi:transposase
MENESSIVYQENKKTGVVYVYENHPFWDSEKKRSRATRKILGKLDPATGKIVPTKGHNAKNPPAEASAPLVDSRQIIKKILDLLKLFMCETLAKRLLSMILIVAGVSDDPITEWTNLSGQSVRTLRKSIACNEDIDSLFHVGGGGRKSKLAGVEKSIIEEINNNNYHSHQQIADMIQEKHGIKVSLPAISRLLKKTASNA